MADSNTSQSNSRPLASLHVSVDDRPVRRSLLSGESTFARLGLSSGDLLVLAVAFFFCTAIGPFFVFPTYTPRMVLLLLAVLPGIVVARPAWHAARDRAAVAACVLAVWIVVAALFSRCTPARARWSARS